MLLYQRTFLQNQWMMILKIQILSLICETINCQKFILLYFILLLEYFIARLFLYCSMLFIVLTCLLQEVFLGHPIILVSPNLGPRHKIRRILRIFIDNPWVVLQAHCRVSVQASNPTQISFVRRKTFPPSTTISYGQMYFLFRLLGLMQACYQVGALRWLDLYVNC